jgi:hypothetical protein
VSESDSSPDAPASRVAFLRHPLFVGAAVAVIGAVFASLLIPSITQVTQDRPKELELKRTIVERIAEATGIALNKGVALSRTIPDVVAAGGQPGQEPRTVYRQVNGDWLVAASAIDGEVTTYFGHGGAWQDWRTLQDSVTSFLRLSSLRWGPGTHNVRIRAQRYLCGHLGVYVSSEYNRKLLQGYCKNPNTFLTSKNFSNVALGLNTLLVDVRDALTVRIVNTPAAGFRHSPWSLG